MSAPRRLALAALALAGAGLGAQAGQCDRFDEPLAYNACLAKLGPKAYFGQGAQGRAEPREGRAPRRGRGGRMHMEFGGVE